MNKDKCCGNCAHFKNEDFVSYEIAKKLKEKGFKWDNIATYNSRTKVRNNHTEPIISQVLKWLREREIRIDIVVYPIDRSTAFIGGEIYTISIYIDRERDIEINRNGKDKYRTYEQAALAGIEYVIDNLI